MSVDRTCAYPECGQTFTVRAPSRRGKYCSHACYVADRTWSSTPLPDEYELAWLTAYQDQRVERWLPLLTAGAHSVRFGDGHGVQVLWERAVRANDMEAFFTAALARIAQLEDALTEGERDRAGEAA